MMKQFLAISMLVLFSISHLPAQNSSGSFTLKKLNRLISAKDTSSSEPYIPGRGFKLYSSGAGEVSLKILSYIRYLNQTWLDSSYTNAFGKTSHIDKRQDIQVNKVNITFTGWILDPKLKYLFYVWTCNATIGQTASVIVAGNVNYELNKHFSFGAGINSLPGVRSTEGNFPYWLSLDNRLIADEFFRPSYTTGLWVKGEFAKTLRYSAMIGNDLSQFGIDAGQLDNVLNTVSVALAWFPTTGEFGLNSNLGDFENHQKIATRLAGHFTFSDEDKESQPKSDAFENVQLRLSDGTVIFTSDLFGSGISINSSKYFMSNFDAGIKYKGFSLDGSYYWRVLNDFRGPGINMLPFSKRTDTGFLTLASYMLVQKSLQFYAGYSKVLGQYGNPYGARTGLNWYPYKNYTTRFNLEYIYTYKSPVGGITVPYLVGGTGGQFHLDFLLNI